MSLLIDLPNGSCLWVETNLSLQWIYELHMVVVGLSCSFGGSVNMRNIITT